VRSLDRRGALGVLASLTGAAALGRSARADAPVVRIGVGSADTFAEGFYAADMGFFTKAGLNVDLQTFNSGGNILVAAGGNAIDIGISNTGNLANAIAHGAPFTLIAGAGMYTASRPTTVLMVALNSPLRTPADLTGKTIAVTALKDLTEVGTRAWLHASGVNPDGVKFIELSMSQMPAGLERGTFDAAIIGEPGLSAARGKTLRVFANAYDAVGPQFLIANWFSTTDFVKKNPDIVKRVVGAVYETARWANANHAASGKILAKWTKMDASAVATMGRCEYATSLDAKFLDPVLAAMYRYDAIDRRLTAADLVTTLKG
jgi:ABC-type nitrate/sulfonate/bicarbonate transport system substrate-binding protein